MAGQSMRSRIIVVMTAVMAVQGLGGGAAGSQMERVRPGSSPAVEASRTAGAVAAPGVEAAAGGVVPGETGAIAGRVVIPERPAQRTAPRYAGTTPAPARSVQAVPAVVYLEGEFGGAAGSTSRQRIAQRDTAFAPAALVVTAGTMVDFLNDDPFFHNVFSYSKPKRFDLGRYPRGESKAVRFDEPGVVKVYCEVHQSMRALVAVVNHPYHAVAGEDGRFSIAGVPAGRHRLVVVDADRGTRTVQVEVAAGRTTTVEVSF